MPVTLFGIVTEVNQLSLNASELIYVTLEGISIEFNPLSLNTSGSIVVMPLGRVISSNASHHQKASEPIEVTVLGIFIEDSL